MLNKGFRLMIVELWTKVKNTLIDLKNSDAEVKVTCEVYQKLNENKTIDVLIRLLYSREKKKLKIHNFSV